MNPGYKVLQLWQKNEQPWW